MGDTNCIVAIVKILEKPKQIIISNNIFKTEFRVQFPQVRKNKTGLISLCLWGNLARDIVSYYEVNDYILIEGYLSARNSEIQTRKFDQKNLKKIQITVLKVYPFLLSYNRKKPLASNQEL